MSVRDFANRLKTAIATRSESLLKTMATGMDDKPYQRAVGEYQGYQRALGEIANALSEYDDEEEVEP